MQARFVLRYGLHGIRRGGQRVFVAALCIMFGVMSLVAMVSLAGSVSEVLMVDPRLGIGGDARLWRQGGFLTEEDIAQIAAFQAEGLIGRYALLETPGGLVLKTPDSGRVTFLRGGTGFEPGAYPLLGEIVLGAPAGAWLQDVLQAPGDVVVTRDIALERGLKVGDPVLATNRLGGRPRRLRVAGIAVSTPGYEGGQLYYSLETSRMVTGRALPVTAVAILWGPRGPEAAQAALAAGGWQMQIPQLSEQSVEIRETFDLMLKGAGLLGLLVGGVGIANTMQVLLARRKDEVAVLKTLGYPRRDMIVLFAVETALMGLIGSLLGVAAGAGLSYLLARMGERVITLFLPWRFDAWIAVGGLAIGVVSTVLFALDAILQASEVRPAALFRRLPAAGRS